jgi:large subunit ribosomal protein L21
VGRPTIAGAVVSLAVEEHTQDEKLVIFKKRRRKNFKRTTGFRRRVSILRVTDILRGPTST